MRAALLAIVIACGTAEALPSNGAALTIPVGPWYGSPCKTPADCMPAGQTVPGNVTCEKTWAYQPDSPSYCRGGVIACEVYADGGASACGPGACCWGPTEYNTDGGPGWHAVPGKGECQPALLPGYCSHVGP